MAHRLGITSPLNAYLSIGLGAEAVNPLEMARAYATFAHGGQRIDGSRVRQPAARDQLRRPADEPTARSLLDQNAPINRQVLDPAKNALLDEHPADGRPVRHRQGARSSAAAGRVAGKTGTTENYGDAWFVGYTPQLVDRRLGRLPEQARRRC